TPRNVWPVWSQEVAPYFESCEWPKKFEYDGELGYATTAIASISIINSGSASELTSTMVSAG
ncbi:MAG: hypothetical protein RI942_2192, partial [Pseudomonadota bacterium]